MPLIARSSTPLRSGANRERSPAELLNIDVFRQEKTKWCWAAIGQALKRFYTDERLTQAQIAKLVMLELDCVAAPDSCNMEESMQIVLLRLGFGLPRSAAQVPFSVLAEELSQKRPLVLLVLPGGIAHFVLVKGCERSQQWLEIDDPARGHTGTVPYEALVRGQSHLGTWTHTYCTQGKP